MVIVRKTLMKLNIKIKNLNSNKKILKTKINNLKKKNYNTNKNKIKIMNYKKKIHNMENLNLK
jgi:hypothetical protein